MWITWISLGFDILFAGLYYGMARAVSQRKVSGNAEWALMGFAAWWAAVALNSGLSAVGKVTQMTIGWSPEAYFGFIAITFLIIVYGLMGLQYYLTFLVSGWKSSWKPIMAYYLLFLGYTVYLVALSDPTNVYLDHETGNLAADYMVDLEGTPEVAIFSLGLIVPVLIGSALYASFFFRVEDRSQKFRIAMVSIGFFVWFGVGLAGSIGAQTGLLWAMFSKLIALIAIWMNYQAFRPAKWVQSWLRIQPM